MYIVNMASSSTHEDDSLDHLDYISLLLAQDNDLEEEITYVFNEVFLFSSLEKNYNQSDSKYTQNVHI